MRSVIAAGVALATAGLLAASGLAITACSSDDPDTAGNGGPPPGTTPATTGPTFHRDVEPIVQNHCQKCHQPGGLAPFSLVTYADARPMAPVMVRETAARRMPPWGAQDSPECKPRLPFDHDERLTDIEIATIEKWSGGGAPEGDPADAPPPKTLGALTLPNPTHTLTPKAPFVASGSRDQFHCFVLDPPSAGPVTYVGGIHVVPGNRKVVHHAVVLSDPKGVLAARAGADGSFDCPNVAMASEDPAAAEGRVILDVWVPGTNPIDLPPNIAIPILQGSKLVMQIHYSPGGTEAEPDTTKVELRVSTTKPEYLLFTTAIGNVPAATNGEGLLPGPNDPTSGVEFKIPANVQNHVESMQVTIPAPEPGKPATPMWIYGVMAHQHLAGVDVKVDLDRAGDSQCLLQDKWDFHWQRMYTYAAPVERLPTLQPNDKIKLRCTYDNTMNNRRLASEYRARGLVPVDIKLGEETVDEMCLAIPQILIRHP